LSTGRSRNTPRTVAHSSRQPVVLAVGGASATYRNNGSENTIHHTATSTNAMRIAALALAI